MATRSNEVIAVALLGSGADTILHANTYGNVLAVFRRSFYVRFGDEVLCIGPQSLDRGPLNALCMIPRQLVWPDEGVVLDARVLRTESMLRVGNALHFDFGNARTWFAPVANEISQSTLLAGVASLATATTHRCPGGLGMLLATLPRPFEEPQVGKAIDPLIRAAMPTIISMRRWLHSALAGSDESAPAVDALVGLGPGLTPSGDDFLCGMMVALHYLGHAMIAQRLAMQALPVAAHGTNLISAAYLRYASAGQASGVLFDVLESLVSGGDAHLAQRLDAVHAVGHTSGWDSLAGAATACTEIAVADMRR